MAERAADFQRQLDELKEKEKELLKEKEGSASWAIPHPSTTFEDSERSPAKESSGSIRDDKKVFPKEDEEAGPSTIWRSMKGAYSIEKSTSAASASASAPQETEPTDTVIFDGDEYVLSAGKTDQVELERLHTQMYDRQCHGGRFHPVPKSKYDRAMMGEQVKCDHPRGSMRSSRSRGRKRNTARSPKPCNRSTTSFNAFMCTNSLSSPPCANAETL